MSRDSADYPGGGEPARTITSTTVESPRQSRLKFKRTAAVVVCYRKERGRGKRKYSRGLKDIQRLESGMTSAAHRVSDAVARGLRTYQKSRNKSSRKKRDGAIEDIFENMSKGFGTFLRRASDAPLDITRKLNRKRVRRNVEGILRMMPSPFR